MYCPSCGTDTCEKLNNDEIKKCCRCIKVWKFGQNLCSPCFRKQYDESIKTRKDWERRKRPASSYYPGPTVEEFVAGKFDDPWEENPKMGWLTKYPALLEWMKFLELRLTLMAVKREPYPTDMFLKMLKELEDMGIPFEQAIEIMKVARARLDRYRQSIKEKTPDSYSPTYRQLTERSFIPPEYESNAMSSRRKASVPKVPMMHLSEVRITPGSIADIHHIPLSLDWKGTVLKFPEDYELYRVMLGDTPISLMAFKTKPFVGDFYEGPTNIENYLDLSMIEKFERAKHIPGIGAVSLMSAINISKQKGMEGRLILWPTEDAMPFYQHMGMIKVTPKYPDSSRQYIFTAKMADAYLTWVTGYLSHKNWVESNPNDDDLILYGNFSVNPDIKTLATKEQLEEQMGLINGEQRKSRDRIIKGVGRKPDREWHDGLRNIYYIIFGKYSFYIEENGVVHATDETIRETKKKRWSW